MTADERYSDLNHGEVILASYSAITSVRFRLSKTSKLGTWGTKRTKQQKPRKDGPLKIAFGDPLIAVSEGLAEGRAGSL